MREIETDWEYKQVDRRDFVLKHGVTAYVAEVNGISIADAQRVIAEGRVNVAYLLESLELNEEVKR